MSLDPHFGLAAYFPRALWRDATRLDAAARLLVDPRWPWLPWWAEFVGVDKRDDQRSARVGGKNGVAPLLEGLTSPRFGKLRMNRTMGDRNYTSVLLDLGRCNEESRGWEAPFRLLMTCRAAEHPAGRTIEAWISLAHALVTTVGALPGILGVWPTYRSAVGDTLLVRVVLDTPAGNYNLGIAGDFERQMNAVTRWEPRIGRTYARYPRWGTYLNAAHVQALGGIDHVRAVLQPARVDAVGELTYVQLTDDVASALTPQADERRRAFEALMAPILPPADSNPR